VASWERSATDHWFSKDKPVAAVESKTKSKSSK
jgi:hypothetical protein